MQNEYLLLKIDFQSGNFVLNDFWKQQMYFLTLDKIFILDNFSVVQDKKYFVRAEGQGNSPCIQIGAKLLNFTGAARNDSRDVSG